eukprot:TRINITY_DN47489_c0_g1_i1.p1 TRINITY_DN47489_c0_g1~~TRINITY_DN47489_c0_g1_i1.p1  ORF type:complete len:894 (+),score=299.24 TRINITY_DN47489_c0_g1_i1:215-2896(+)
MASPSPSPGDPDSAEIATEAASAHRRRSSLLPPPGSAPVAAPAESAGEPTQVSLRLPGVLPQPSVRHREDRKRHASPAPSPREQVKEHRPMQPQASGQKMSAMPSSQRREQQQNRHTFDDVLTPELIDKVKSRLRAAAYDGRRGVDIKRLFAKVDKDGSGKLDREEFRHALRVKVKLSPEEVSDKAFNRLFKVLDPGQSGAIEVDELEKFVEEDGLSSESEEADISPMKGLQTGSSKMPPEMARRSLIDAAAHAKPLDDEVLEKVRKRLRAAAYDGPRGVNIDRLFRKLDKDGSGKLDHEEFRLALRMRLRISPDDLSDSQIAGLCLALDDDGDGYVEVYEIVHFLEPDWQPSKHAPMAVQHNHHHHAHHHDGGAEAGCDHSPGGDYSSCHSQISGDEEDDDIGGATDGDMEAHLGALLRAEVQARKYIEDSLEMQVGMGARLEELEENQHQLELHNEELQAKLRSSAEQVLELGEQLRTSKASRRVGAQATTKDQRFAEEVAELQAQLVEAQEALDGRHEEKPEKAKRQRGPEETELALTATKEVEELRSELAESAELLRRREVEDYQEQEVLKASLARQQADSADTERGFREARERFETAIESSESSLAHRHEDLEAHESRAAVATREKGEFEEEIQRLQKGSEEERRQLEKSAREALAAQEEQGEAQQKRWSTENSTLKLEVSELQGRLELSLREADEQRDALKATFSDSLESMALEEAISRRLHEEMQSRHEKLLAAEASVLQKDIAQEMALKAEFGRLEGQLAEKAQALQEDAAEHAKLRSEVVEAGEEREALRGLQEAEAEVARRLREELEELRSQPSSPTAAPHAEAERALEPVWSMIPSLTGTTAVRRVRRMQAAPPNAGGAATVGRAFLSPVSELSMEEEGAPT